MKLVSWNVNGLRACMEKGFLEKFNALNADFFCLQEIRLAEGQLALDLPGYEQYWCYAQKKGYSGTAIFTKHTPMSVRYGLGVEELDNEGRMITLEYPEFFLVTCYTPNAQRELARIDHRMKWDDAFRAYLSQLDAQKPVILCGDLNVAHQEIDLKNPKSNRGNAGFSDQERESFSKTLDLGFSDTFRQLHPDAVDAYTWWSYMFKAREKNVGWRIDYFLVSDRIKETVYRADIHSDIFGSDHCPVSIETDLPCNGSIWSPITPRVPIPEKNNNTAPKGAVLGAFGTILAVFFCLLLFLPKGQQVPPPATDPTVPRPLTNDFFTVQSFEEPLQPVINRSVNFFSAYYTGSQNFYTGAKLLITQYRAATNIFRIDLTNKGFGQVAADWTVEIQCPEINAPYIRAIPWYSDVEKTQFAGWIVFSDLPENASLSVLVKDSDDVLIANIPCTLTVPTYSTEFTVRQCDLLSITADPDDPYFTAYATDLGTFYHPYPVLDYTSPSITDMQETQPTYQYCFYVQPPQQVLADGIFTELALHAYTSDESDTTPDGFFIANQIITRRVYLDADCTIGGGWIVYGLTPIRSLVLSMYVNETSYRQELDVHIPFQPEHQLTYCDIPTRWDYDPRFSACYLYNAQSININNEVMFVQREQIDSTLYSHCILVEMDTMTLLRDPYSSLDLKATNIMADGSASACRTVAVYSDEDLNTVCGWLLYVSPGAQTVQIDSFRHNEQDWEQHRASYDAVGSILPGANVTVYESLDPIEYGPLSGSVCIPVNSDDHQVFTSRQLVENLENATHIALITMPEHLRNPSMSHISCNILHAFNFSNHSDVGTIVVYSNSACTQICGWILYTQEEEVTDICLRILCVQDNNILCLLSPMPDLNADTPKEKVEPYPTPEPPAESDSTTPT